MKFQSVGIWLEAVFALVHQKTGATEVELRAVKLHDVYYRKHNMKREFHLYFVISRNLEILTQIKPTVVRKSRKGLIDIDISFHIT